MTGVAPFGLTARRLNRTTLLRQSLLGRSTEDAVAAVGRLAGLQAQYANSPYIALWSRLADFGIADLERALEQRTVVKATVMRGTLHLVAAGDYPAFSVASSVARIANWRPSAERVGVETVALHRTLLAFAHQPRSITEMEAELEKILPDASIVGKVPAGVRHVGFRMADAHGWLVHVPPSGNWDAPHPFHRALGQPPRGALDGLTSGGATQPGGTCDGGPLWPLSSPPGPGGTEPARSARVDPPTKDRISGPEWRSSGLYGPWTQLWPDQGAPHGSTLRGRPD